MDKKDSIDNIMYKESLQCDAYIYKGRPFDFIKQNITKYSKKYTLGSLYNFSLDNYNWMNRNGIHYDSKRKALMNTLRMVLETTGY